MKRISYLLLACSVGPIIAGCSAGPNDIPGTFVMRIPTEAHINLGNHDGIQVGDTLTEWRDESRGATRTRNLRIDEVKVVRVNDQAHSVVEILRGKPEERDTVEMRSR